MPACVFPAFNPASRRDPGRRGRHLGSGCEGHEGAQEGGPRRAQNCLCIPCMDKPLRQAQHGLVADTGGDPQCRRLRLGAEPAAGGGENGAHGLQGRLDAETVHVQISDRIARHFRGEPDPLAQRRHILIRRVRRVTGGSKIHTACPKASLREEARPSSDRPAGSSPLPKPFHDQRMPFSPPSGRLPVRSRQGADSHAAQPSGRFRLFLVIPLRSNRRACLKCTREGCALRGERPCSHTPSLFVLQAAPEPASRPG